MRKLNLHDLEVESFATAGHGAHAGTVLGHMPPVTLWTCPEAGCPPQTEGCPVDPPPTYNATCPQTCWEGCHLSLGGDPQNFTCNPDCFSYYTDCHRC